jgi:hypothetical protein
MNIERALKALEAGDQAKADEMYVAAVSYLDKIGKAALEDFKRRT